MCTILVAPHDMVDQRHNTCGTLSQQQQSRHEDNTIVTDAIATPVIAAPSSSQRDSRDEWSRQSKCAGCGVQLFDMKKIGWRRNKIALIPLTVEGRVSRGQCVSCTFQRQLQQQQSQSQTQQSQQSHQTKIGQQSQSQSQPSQPQQALTPSAPQEVIIPSSPSTPQPSPRRPPLRKVLSLIDDDDEENEEDEELLIFTKIFNGDKGVWSDDSGRENTIRQSKLQQPVKHNYPDKSLSKKTKHPQPHQGPSVFYDGELNAFGQPDGKGEMIFATGDRYHGQFLNGKIHGQGTMLFENGSKYIGSWESGYMHGRGTFHFANGDVYSGDYQQSKRSGQGRMEFSNGDLYTGSWQDGHMHGLGQYHYHNGHKFSGNFVMGARHGKGKYHYADGEMVVHRYVHDHRMGEGVQFSADRSKVWRSVGGKRKGRITQRQAEIIMLRCDED